MLIHFITVRRTSSYNEKRTYSRKFEDFDSFWDSSCGKQLIIPVKLNAVLSINQIIKQRETLKNLN